MATFVPRTVFPTLESIPRSYFLGHHRAGLTKMTSMLSQIDLILECRDYRVPLTSRNPLFETALAGRERMIVYTKRDLGSSHAGRARESEKLIRNWHRPSTVLFTDHHHPRDVRAVLDHVWQNTQLRTSLTGTRMMVVGMPNVGKSSLLNALRKEGIGKGKAARTGAQPGITRKVATGVKIIEGSERSEGVYLVDTPGVFIPYVPDAEAMMKLALCGNVKDTIVQPVTLVDFLLYKINLIDPGLYAQYCRPTNDAMDLITSVAQKTGRLAKGGTVDVDATALWIIQRWRTGHFGCFMLDDVSSASLETHGSAAIVASSLNQARKAFKEERRARQRAKSTSAD